MNIVIFEKKFVFSLNGYNIGSLHTSQWIQY